VVAAGGDVTVVIPAWDDYAEKYLHAAVDSVADQSPRPRILVIDNASREPIPPTGDQVVRTEERLTVGGARNLGLHHVNTEYVVFWDADDRMLPGTLQSLHDALAADGGVVASATRLVHEDGTLHHWPRLAVRRLAPFRHAFALLQAVSSLFPTTGSVMMRTEAFRAAGGFPPIDAGDDWVAGMSLALRGRVAILPMAGCVYRRHGGSVSAGWTARTRLGNARSVRDRWRREPALPAPVRLAAPLLAPAHWFVLLVLRPVRLAFSGARHRAPLPRPATMTSTDGLSAG
jgi:hypothetical protein